MLEHLTGNEGLASPELIADLRTLCRLDQSEILAMAGAFAQVRDELSVEDLPQELLKAFRGSRTDPQQLATAAKIAVFLLDRWGQRNLIKENVVQDLQSINVGADAIRRISPLLDALEGSVQALKRKRIESAALHTATPRIHSATYVVDGRAIFGSSDFEEDKGDTQKYLRVDRFVPVVLLEVVSELNNVKSTQGYILTERELGQLIDILLRARKGLLNVKASLAHSPGKASDE